MSNTPAGWYPDPERAGASRFWDGQTGGARSDTPKTARSSRLLAGFAIGVGLLATLAIGGGMLVGASLLGMASAFGMPDPGSAAAEALPRWAATGAVIGLPFLIISLVLVILASTRNERAKTSLVIAWVVVGFGLLAVPLFLTTAQPIWL